MDFKKALVVVAASTALLVSECASLEEKKHVEPREAQDEPTLTCTISSSTTSSGQPLGTVDGWNLLIDPTVFPTSRTFSY